MSYTIKGKVFRQDCVLLSAIYKAGCSYFTLEATCDRNNLKYGFFMESFQGVLAHYIHICLFI